MKEKIIQNLKGQIKAVEFMISNSMYKDNKPWQEEIEILNEAINLIEEIDNLKREVMFFSKRAVEAEMLLREVQPYCPVLAKNQISDFFKK